MFIDVCCWFAWIAFEMMLVFKHFGMETLFNTLLNHQRLDHVHCFLLLVCMNSHWNHGAWKLCFLPPWITKMLIIFIDFFLLVSMNSHWNDDGFHAIWHEHLISRPLESQKNYHFDWFWLQFCTNSLSPVVNFIWTQRLSFQWFLCYWFAWNWNVFEMMMAFLQFGMQTLFTAPWITKVLVIFIDCFVITPW